MIVTEYARNGQLIVNVFNLSTKKNDKKLSTFFFATLTVNNSSLAFSCIPLNMTVRLIENGDKKKLFASTLTEP